MAASMKPIGVIPALLEIDKAGDHDEFRKQYASMSMWLLNRIKFLRENP